MISRLFSTTLLLVVLTVAAAQNLPDAPGELVDVNDHALHLYCEGEGSPTVILETGLGDGAINFRSLQSRVATFTRVCSYDRAGYGWSETGPEPRDVDTLVSELETLLNNAGVDGPYVMAGHSYGGILSWVFANRNPEEVRGVVLIDSSHPDQLTALAAVPEVVAVQDMEIEGLAGVVAAAEAGQLPAEAVMPNAPPVLSSSAKQTWATLFVQPKQLRAVVAEYDAIGVGLEQASGSVDIGAIPLTVLSRGIGLEGQLPAEALEGLGLTPDVLERFDEVWSELQADLVGLSTNAKRVVAENSNHYIYYGQPELVVAAIRELVNEAP
ncbi:MAG TPA: alpha/beta hydrolase [Trueperaceae bacterium]|nr:alpha/beta hydrolase [Trueperaceae bacterium]